MNDSEEYLTFIFTELAEVRAENGILKELLKILLAEAAQRSGAPANYISAIGDRIQAQQEESRGQTSGLPRSAEAMALHQHIDWYLRSILDETATHVPTT